MAITFLGYLGNADNTTPADHARMIFGLDTEADAASLPTSSGFVFPDGTVSLPPAPWSIAVFPGGRKALTSALQWVDL